MALVNSNQFGASYTFGFQSTDAPVITGFFARTAELRYEAEVFATGTNVEGHTIAVAVSAPTRRKIVGTFSGYLDTTFQITSIKNPFIFQNRNYVVKNIGDIMKKGEFDEVSLEAESYFYLPTGGVSIGDLEYYGATSFVESQGELVTDIFGLQTCETTFRYIQGSSFNTLPSLFESNPFFPWLHLERQKVDVIPGFLLITSGYAGVAGGASQSAPIYELSLGLGEDPIQTHPKFVTEIAGTPSTPQNGAIFLTPTGDAISTDDATGTFDRFANVVGGVQNPFAGLQSYLAADQMVWRERYVSTTVPVIANVGYIDTPHGPAPGLDPPRNWISMGTTYEQRGLAYFVCNEWRASGPFGWNTIIYSPAA